MAAYLVYLCQSVNDRKELEKYWELIMPTFAGVPIKLLSSYMPFDILEGEGPVEGVVMAEFPSMEAARQWYDSPSYREVRQHRMRGAKYLGLLLQEGMAPPGEWMAHTKT